MSGISAKSQLESIEVEATIIRADGTVEELGRVAYTHRNPLKRWLGQRKVRGGSLRGVLRGVGSVRTDNHEIKEA